MQIPQVSEQLPNEWRIWVTFDTTNVSNEGNQGNGSSNSNANENESHPSSNQNQHGQHNYGDNLKCLFTLKNWSDFAYIYKESHLLNPVYYFPNPQTHQYNKIQIDGRMRKIQSIDFFKNSIEPKWQYEQNKKGGFYMFSVPKNIEDNKLSQIFEKLIISTVGNSTDIGPRVNGIRVVDTLHKKMFRAKFQIWVDYRDDETNTSLTLIKKHVGEIQSILKNIDIEIGQIKFNNIGDKIHQVKKEKK